MGWKQPELVEDTVLSQVTLNLSLVAEENEDRNFIQKNDRSLTEVLTEVLSKKNYEKILPIAIYLDEHKEITPQKAQTIVKKSKSTVYRYLSMLVETGFVEVDGNTNNAVYRVVGKL